MLSEKCRYAPHQLDKSQEHTSMIIIEAYGGQSESFQSFGPIVASRGIIVVSC